MTCLLLPRPTRVACLASCPRGQPACSNFSQAIASERHVSCERIQRGSVLKSRMRRTLTSHAGNALAAKPFSLEVRPGSPTIFWVGGDMLDASAPTTPSLPRLTR